MSCFFSINYFEDSLLEYTQRYLENCVYTFVKNYKKFYVFHRINVCHHYDNEMQKKREEKYEILFLNATFNRLESDFANIS